MGGGCLCIFDMDRTLTGSQEDIDECPENRVVWSEWDDAYEGGRLTLSDLGQNIRRTFCGECHLGGITAHGSYRNYLHAIVHHRVIRGCDGGCKVREAERMAKNLGVSKGNVFLFDDKSANVWPFLGSGMN